MNTEIQGKIDADNASFWDELCGSSLARSIGVTDASPESLRRFDEAYMGLYPYLPRHLAPVVSRRGRTLEVGLGYGTVSGYLGAAGIDYHGVDIALQPVEMVRERLSRLGLANPSERVRQGSALEIPWADGHFDAVVSIGCLHHTGDLARAVSEVLRVLSPGGVAMVMLYNRNSFRQLAFVRPMAAWSRLRGRLGNEGARRMYDSNSAGEAAPFTEFATVRSARQLFSACRTVNIVKENMEGSRWIRRARLLGWPAHLLGLDLYITAVK